MGGCRCFSLPKGGEGGPTHSNLRLPRWESGYQGCPGSCQIWARAILAQRFRVLPRCESGLSGVARVEPHFGMCIFGGAFSLFTSVGLWAIRAGPGRAGFWHVHSRGRVFAFCLGGSLGCQGWLGSCQILSLCNLAQRFRV